MRGSPSLLCPETDAIFSEIESEGDEFSYYLSENLNYLSENEDEYVKLLLQKERDFGYGCYDAQCEIKSKTWMKCARLDSIDWIFNTGAYLGFQIHTAYLSITFFDRFLSKRPINEGKFWAFPLLSVVCLSLAAKIEETKVPSLSDFPIKEFNVENALIQKMELLVLTALEWKMDSLTPFSYLHYFVSKIHDDFRPNEVVSRAVKLIVAMIRDISFLDFRPSIVAAAAVLAASDDKLTRKALEIKMEFICLQNDDVYSCYNMIQEMEEKSNTPHDGISSGLSSESLDSHSALSRARTKRKLTFSHYEEGLEKRKTSVMIVGD